MIAATSGRYVWRTDLIERHSLTLTGPEGWLAHVLRNDDGTWYGYAPGPAAGHEVLVDLQPDVRAAMKLVYTLVARCNWPVDPGQRPCVADRAPNSHFCTTHAADAQALLGRAVTEPQPDRLIC